MDHTMNHKATSLRRRLDDKQQDEHEQEQNGCSAANPCPQNITILLDGVFREFHEYVSYHAANYQQLNPHIQITLEQAQGDFLSLQDRLVNDAAHGAQIQQDDDAIRMDTNDNTAMDGSSSSSWDGSIFPSQITGSLVASNVLWDMSEYVRESSELNWPDIMPFYRQQLAMYDQTVRVMPLDGDVIVMYYRKDLFDQYQIQVPRTWDEYSEAAKFFHGKSVGPNNERIAGSCVSRINKCGNAYWSSLLLSSITQTQGTNTGFLFDPENMDHPFHPLLGPAFDQTLKWTTDHFLYGDQDELDGNCLAVNLNFSMGQCALTYNWGNQMLTLANQSNFEIGIAPTPGSQMVLDRSSGLLVKCTPSLCPHAKVYEDIGQVNVAPYGAFGGWAAGVNNLATESRQHATADFFAYISNAEQSVPDVLPNSRSIRFAQPYRYSHATASRWISAGGFDEELATDFTESSKEINSPNAVIELRIPGASKIRDVIDDHVYSYLKRVLAISSAMSSPFYGSNDIPILRREVTKSVGLRLQQVVTELEQKHANQQRNVTNLNTTTTLWGSYQQSLGVYANTALRQNYIDTVLRHAGWSLAGLVGGAALILMVWTWKNRNHRVMKASQPSLLLQCCLGIFVSSSSIVLLSFDESLGFSVDTLSITCMLSPWVYAFGFSILFSAIYAKIRQYQKVYAHPELYNVLQVSPTASVKSCARLLAINGTILTIWTLVDPLRWTREVVPDGAFDNSLLFHNGEVPETYGVCKGESEEGYYIAFAILLGAVNLFMLIAATTQAFKCQFLEVEFNEIQWLPLALLPFIEFWLVGGPVLFLVQFDSTGTFAVLVSIISVSSIACIMALFASKEWHIRKHSSKGRPKPTANDGTVPGTMVLKHPDVEDGKEIGRLQTNLDEINKSNEMLEEEIRVMKKRLAESDKANNASPQVVINAQNYFGSTGSDTNTEDSGARRSSDNVGKMRKISRDYNDILSMEDEEFENVWKMQSETDDHEDDDVAAVFEDVPSAEMSPPLSQHSNLEKDFLIDVSALPSCADISRNDDRPLEQPLSQDLEGDIEEGGEQHGNHTSIASAPEPPSFLPATPEKGAIDVFESPNKSLDGYDDTSPVSNGSKDAYGVDKTNVLPYKSPLAGASVDGVSQKSDTYVSSYLNSSNNSPDSSDRLLMTPQTPSASFYENEDAPPKSGSNSSPNVVATTASFASSEVIPVSSVGSLSMDDYAPSVNVPNSTFCSSNSSDETKDVTPGSNAITKVVPPSSSSVHSSKSTDETKTTQATSVQSTPDRPNGVPVAALTTTTVVEPISTNVQHGDTDESSEEEWDPYFAHFQKAAKEEIDDGNAAESQSKETQAKGSQVTNSSVAASNVGVTTPVPPTKNAAVESSKSSATAEHLDDSAEDWDPYAMHFAKAAAENGAENSSANDSASLGDGEGSSSSEDDNGTVRKKDYRELKSAIKSNNLAALEAKAAALADTLSVKLSQSMMDDTLDSEASTIKGGDSQGASLLSNGTPDESLTEMIFRESDQSMLGPELQGDHEKEDLLHPPSNVARPSTMPDQGVIYPQFSTDSQDAAENGKQLASAGESSAADETSFDTSNEQDGQLPDPMLEPSLSNKPTQNAGEPSRGDLRYDDKSDLGEKLRDRRIPSGSDNSVGIDHFHIMEQTSTNPIQRLPPAVIRNSDSLPIENSATQLNKTLEAASEGQVGNTRLGLAQRSSSSKFSLGEWAAVGTTASILADWSDSQSCSSYSSRADSTSSMDATKGASSLETPLANKLDSLVRSQDWDGVRQTVDSKSNNNLNNDEEDHQKNIEEVRRRKREIEAWRDSISNSLAKSPNTSLAKSPDRSVSRSANNSLLRSSPGAYTKSYL